MMHPGNTRGNGRSNRYRFSRRDPLPPWPATSTSTPAREFTLRGKNKVDGQWKLFCLVHNIEKLAHQGYAQ
jgi:hypothetical protein